MQARLPTRPVSPNTKPDLTRVMARKSQEAFAAIVPDDADVGAVAEAIMKVVDAPLGKRRFRVHIDPTRDGAEVAFGVIDRVRMEMLNRVRLDELLSAVKK